jgi:membrane protein
VTGTPTGNTFSALRHALREIWFILHAAFRGWLDDRAASIGAAIAFYTTFSLAPLLVVIIGIAGLVLGERAAQGVISEQLVELFGQTGAAAIEAMLAGAANKRAGILATVFGLCGLALAASAVFGELQAAMNLIWKVRNPKTNLKGLVLRRVRSLILVAGIGVIQLLAIGLTTLLAATRSILANIVPGLDVIMLVLGFAIGFAVTTVLFALVYTVLPDRRIAWHDVWFGATVSALLFSLGRLVIALYLGSSNTASSYGAASALVLILLWVYYSTQIFLFGVELTKSYADRRALRDRGTAAPVSPAVA